MWTGSLPEAIGANHQVHVPETAKRPLDVAEQSVTADRLCAVHGLGLTGSPLRFVFLAAQDTEAIRTGAIRAGGAASFGKPGDDQTLFDALR